MCPSVQARFGLPSWVIRHPSSHLYPPPLLTSSSWTASPHSLSNNHLPLLFVNVLTGNAFRSLGSQPTPRPLSQPIHAPKPPLTTAPRTIQRAPTKPTLTQTLPHPTTRSSRSPHRVPAGCTHTHTHTGDDTALPRPCRHPRTLTWTRCSPAACTPSRCPTRSSNLPSARTRRSPPFWQSTRPSSRTRWRQGRVTCPRESASLRTYTRTGWMTSQLSRSISPPPPPSPIQIRGRTPSASAFPVTTTIP